MADDNTTPVAPVATTWRDKLVSLAARFDAQWLKVWNSGILKKTVTVPLKFVFLGGLVLVASFVVVHGTRRAAPQVAGLLGIPPDVCKAPVSVPKMPAPAKGKVTLKPVKDRHVKPVQSFGLFN